MVVKRCSEILAAQLWLPASRISGLLPRLPWELPAPKPKVRHPCPLGKPKQAHLGGETRFPRAHGDSSFPISDRFYIIVVLYTLYIYIYLLCVCSLRVPTCSGWLKKGNQKDNLPFWGVNPRLTHVHTGWCPVHAQRRAQDLRALRSDLMQPGRFGSHLLDFHVLKNMWLWLSKPFWDPILGDR